MTHAAPAPAHQWEAYTERLEALLALSHARRMSLRQAGELEAIRHGYHAWRRYLAVHKVTHGRGFNEG